MIKADVPGFIKHLGPSGRQFAEVVANLFIDVLVAVVCAITHIASHNAKIRHSACSRNEAYFLVRIFGLR